MTRVRFFCARWCGGLSGIAARRRARVFGARACKTFNVSQIWRETFARSGARARSCDVGLTRAHAPALIEADLMRRVLPRDRFAAWFDAYLPRLKRGEPKTLLEIAVVTDRSDPQLGHLDGLNLSRAWCMRHIAAALPDGDPGRAFLAAAGYTHAIDALTHVATGHYEGEHWLASFAVYLLTESRSGNRE